MRRRLTRRQFLAGGGAVIVGAAAASTGGVLISNATSSRKNRVTGPSASSTATASPSATVSSAPSIPPYTGLQTRPDLDGAAALKVVTSTGAAAPGYIFITPKTPANVQGAAFYDNAGNLIWYRPMNPANDMIHNLQVVEYQGQPMLAWYEGKQPSNSPGFGDGAFFLYNNHYEQVAVIKGGNGSPVDLHELVVTPQGTALVDAYVPVVRDLTAYGGAPKTTVYNCRLEEVDIATGKLLFSWYSLDHVAIAETTEKPPTSPGGSFDYFHINSIALDAQDGNFIISARNTSTVYKIDRKTGDIIWRLRGATAGKAPGRTIKLLPDGESFWYQHDVRSWPDGTLSIFDDGGQPFHHNARGILLTLDEAAGTATITRSDTVNKPVNFEGSYRPQPNGDWAAGWGDQGGFTEFGPDGSIVLNVEFNDNSYRAIRSPWVGEPAIPPDIAVFPDASGRVDVYASWNGSTSVRTWRVLAGSATDSLQAVADFPWSGFETHMTVSTSQPIVAVAALDAAGKLLATSAPRTV